MSPARLHRLVARAEAVTWALLLFGMFLKYGTETTELAVRVFGMLHGVVFIAYCLATVVLSVDQKWSLGRLALGLAAAVPPFATIPFEWYAARHGLLGERWRLRDEEPAGSLERLTARFLRHPAQGVLAGFLAVGMLTGVALLVGPPVG